jgi:hypothetical protein
MTPGNIVNQALQKGLQIIGITDHNSTRNALLTKKLAEKAGIYVLTGAEVNTREEVHCLVFFEGEEKLKWFQEYIEENINRIPNPDGHFGYQPVVDEHDNILELVPYYLHASLKTGISQLQKIVHENGGIFIPAHIDRPANGLFSQLGFFPHGLNPDALEVSRFFSQKHVEKHVEKHEVIPENMTIIRNSDAHTLQQIGEICTVFYIEKPCFDEIKMALHNQHDRLTKAE